MELWKYFVRKVVDLHFYDVIANQDYKPQQGQEQEIDHIEPQGGDSRGKVIVESECLGFQNLPSGIDALQGYHF